MRLRRMGDEVQSRGIFGAPTFFTEDGEMFWGNDRLEQALDWAVAQARRSDWPV
jgi:2-hydroxychromene-2-carboxylate isomerase